MLSPCEPASNRLLAYLYTSNLWIDRPTSVLYQKSYIRNAVILWAPIRCGVGAFFARSRGACVRWNAVREVFHLNCSVAQDHLVHLEKARDYERSKSGQALSNDDVKSMLYNAATEVRPFVCCCLLGLLGCVGPNTPHRHMQVLEGTELHICHTVLYIERPVDRRRQTTTDAFLCVCVYTLSSVSEHTCVIRNEKQAKHRHSFSK